MTGRCREVQCRRYSKSDVTRTTHQCKPTRTSIRYIRTREGCGRSMPHTACSALFCVPYSTLLRNYCRFPSTSGGDGSEKHTATLNFHFNITVSMFLVGLSRAFAKYPSLELMKLISILSCSSRESEFASR